MGGRVRKLLLGNQAASNHTVGGALLAATLLLGIIPYDDQNSIHADEKPPTYVLRVKCAEFKKCRARIFYIISPWCYYYIAVCE